MIYTEIQWKVVFPTKAPRMAPGPSSRSERWRGSWSTRKLMVRQGFPCYRFPHRGRKPKEAWLVAWIVACLLGRLQLIR